MKILFVNHTADWGGAEVALMRLVETLGRSHDIAVACPDPGRLTAELYGRGIASFTLPRTTASLRPHLLHTPRGMLQLAGAGLALESIIRRARPDVVHANGLRAGLMAARGARRRAPPTLVQVHDLLPRNAMGRAIRRTVAASADAVVANSDKTAADFNFGLAVARASRIYISIDHQRFDPTVAGSGTLRADLGMGDAPVLAQVAQITPWKRQHVAIEALARLREAEPSARLVIVGAVSFASPRYDNEAYDRELHGLAERLDVGRAVHFVGQREDLPELMNTVNLTLMPSLDEPFGTAVAESMAMGTPPLVSADGGMSEFVEDGVSGCVLAHPDPTDWAQAAARLLNDRRVLQRMGADAKRVAARFSDDHYAGEMEDSYERIRADRARRGPRLMIPRACPRLGRRP